MLKNLAWHSFTYLWELKYTLENLKKRDERIIKASKKFKQQVDELGVAKDLKKQTEYIYKGLYEDKNVDKDIAAGKQAYKELIKSSEL